MPKFDPVRDAVQNSPIQQQRNDSFPPPNFHSSSTISPTLGRTRATDLSVLLNNTEDTPPPPRSSSLSHLLHNDDDDKLATSQPFRRTSTNLDITGTSPRPSSSRTLPSSPPPQYSHSIPSSSLLQSPVLPPQSPEFLFASRPSSSSSSSGPSHFTITPRTTTSPKMPPPPLARTTLPYNPRERITPASSVLIPMSQSEMDMYKNYRGIGASKLTKRKRAQSESDEPDDRPTKKLAGDVGVVVQHYNARPEVGVVQRLDSPIIGLKNFNNWVKSVLITRFAHPVLAASPTSNNHYYSGPGRGGGGRGAAGKVLDMGCGKGGDITKWAKARVRELIGVDIANVSVDQARSRWEGLRGPRFDATFATLDCYTESLTKAVPPAKLAQPFDVVSLQFCMHYAFENVQKARCMLENVSRYLRVGGVFIGTIPNAELLLDHLDAIPAEEEDLSFGNSVYKIRFENREKPVFGHKYWFYLQDAVENVPEYVVRWDNFVQMAAEYKLYPIYKEEFHQVYEEHREHQEFGPLLVRMKVVDGNGESSMDEDQWEAANIYIAFAFEKR